MVVAALAGTAIDVATVDDADVATVAGPDAGLAGFGAGRVASLGVA